MGLCGPTLRPSMSSMAKPSEVHDRWKEMTARAGRNYMAGQTPEERLYAARDAYVAGHITFETFERIAEETCRAEMILPLGSVV